MHIIDAAHSTVRSYPGGSESLGPRIGMSAAVLRNKVNPNNTTHHLTLAEASEVMGVTGDFQMMHALNAEHGFAAQPVDPTGKTENILQAILRSNAADGALDHELQVALADGRVTPNEAKLVQQAAAKVQAAMVDLIAQVRAMSEGRAQA
ncbi:phage regulatory CII family protein [Lysobacter sp. D1-1-M9]|uniref:phage regulatory CII family protein n=1 Tax=Novilysobacter longmucuonensis TaxID=3098603 RepID=UPI002FCA9BE6